LPWLISLSFRPDCSRVFKQKIDILFYLYLTAQGKKNQVISKKTGEHPEFSFSANGN
jgi:hypothetical protein